MTFSTSKKVVQFIRYEKYIKPLNYKLEELIITERMRSIGQANVESETPYRCHIICHMDPFMIKYISNTSGAFIEYRK